MDADFFVERVKEELADAKTYIKTAIEIRTMNPNWSKQFATMSADELSHATSLFKMYEDYYNAFTKGYSEVPKYLSDQKKDLVDHYSECSAEIKFMHEMYGK